MGFEEINSRSPASHQPSSLNKYLEQVPLLPSLVVKRYIFSIAHFASSNIYNKRGEVPRGEHNMRVHQIFYFIVKNSMSMFFAIKNFSHFLLHICIFFIA